MANAGWVLLIPDKRVGHTNLASPNTEEQYVEIPSGLWVPAVDVEQLLQLERTVCCGEDGGTHRVKIFGRGRPSVDQMRSRPKHEPRLKKQAEPVVTRKRKPRKRKEVSWPEYTLPQLAQYRLLIIVCSQVFRLSLNMVTFRNFSEIVRRNTVPNSINVHPPSRWNTFNATFSPNK